MRNREEPPRGEGDAEVPLEGAEVLLKVLFGPADIAIFMTKIAVPLASGAAND